MYLCLFFTYPEAIRYGLLSIATTCLKFLMASFFVPELMVEVKVITLFYLLLAAPEWWPFSLMLVLTLIAETCMYNTAE